MAFESRQLAMIVGQAAHHLHVVVNHIATALIDTGGNGRMLFSNSALSYVDGGTLTALARDYVKRSAEQLPCIYTHTVENLGMLLYLLVLDDRHVFAIVGTNKDEMLIQEFNERLARLLYGAGV